MDCFAENVPQMLGGQNKRAKLLVVDDQPVNIHVIHGMFSREHDVFMARSGEEALRLCAKISPDLVLLDVEMPGMDGLEVCRQIQEALDQDIPVIFVTGHQSPDDENACWAAGCVDFVSKPVNQMTLRNRVNAHLKLKFQSDLLRQIALIDGLTGVYNRRFFDQRLSVMWSNCLRGVKPLSVIMVDLDNFKRYNDFHGHLSGDECLKKVAMVLRMNMCRPDDYVARFGGEEFVCLLPDTNLSGAILVAQRMEADVRALGIAHGDSDIAAVVTISLGCSSLVPSIQDSEVDLVGRADEQLYRAKHSGKARVCS